ncbi:hypothetical protein DFQ28_000816 [Apophysomyces sp. BC1034]|nr:hypothetical protein DFQ30_000798 [Apophysomyces sp. BC1015]KAG0177135.1 hypothetical protein DFQ29_005198 [Apophysomyces sp. BC1021]KAG0191162.1 hypothetical protein DFQ28_000816 [Apophysomyces sp. BC1034]
MAHYGMSNSPFATGTDRDPAALIANDTQEVPAAAPVFEGHLYLRTEKKQWQRRLFRFDGTQFTCLSTRKVKLPPDTPVDTPNDIAVQLSHLQPSTSFTTSLTSPLLATPKSRMLRIADMDLHNATPVMASYYQLPKWTVDISNISAISVLKQSKKNHTFKSPFSPSISKSRCFCVRTYDGQCHVMKAQKEKDLERWLFVLTKMWKFAQAIRNQVLQQQQQQQEEQQHMPTNQNQLHLFHDTHSQHPPLHRVTPLHNDVPFLQTHPFQSDIDPVLFPRTIPTSPLRLQPLMQRPTPPHLEISTEKEYERRYRAPTLSVEKVQWIDEWRKSLEQLAASDPNIRSTPPPIESLPDDDNISMGSEMTSISARGKKNQQQQNSTSYGRTQITRISPLRRAGSKRSTRSRSNGTRRSNNTNNNNSNNSNNNDLAPAKEMPLEDRPSLTLRKRRSDDVKNWISHKPTGPEGHACVASSPEILNMDFFQDILTACDDELATHSSPDSRAKVAPNIRYHASIRGKNVQVIPNSKSDSLLQHANDPAPRSGTRSLDKERIRSVLMDDNKLNTPSPLQTLAKADNVNAFQKQSAHAPHCDIAPDEQDEEMSLADLQQSLRRMSMQDSYMYMQRTQFDPAPYLYQQNLPIVAPASPPIPMAGPPPLPPMHGTGPPAFDMPFHNDGTMPFRSSVSPQTHLDKKDGFLMKAWMGATAHWDGKKTRPQSWMIPSPPSASTVMEKGPMVAHQRRSIDLAEHRRGSRRWN